MGKKKKKVGYETSTSVALGDPSLKVTESKQATEEMSECKRFRAAAVRSGVKDLRLIPRIKEFLDSKRFSRKKINIYGIVDHLLNRYPEYGRKKRTMFVQYVEKAYAVLKEKEKDGVIDMDSLPVQQDDISSESDDAILVPYKDTNAMNNMMSNMYRNSPKTSMDEDSRGLDVIEEKKRVPDPPHSAKKKIKVDDLSNVKKVMIIQDGHDKSFSQGQAFFIDRNGNNANMKGGGKPIYLPLVTGKNKGSKIETLPESSVDLVYSSTPVASKASVLHTVDDSSIVSHVGDNSAHNKTIDLSSIEQPQDTPKKKKSSKKPKEGSQSEDNVKDKKGPAIQKSTLSFKDVGGNEKNLEEICKLLVHMRHPEVYIKLGITPPRGFLLHGPPGCGKTLLANAVAGELDLPLIKLAATELVSGVSGESEEKIRELFEKAVQCSPCVVFIDEIDAITPKRETASKDMERRIVAQLLSCLDDLNMNLDAQVLIIGATNRPDSLDPALRRAGRFDREICLGIPDEPSRLRILQVLCRDLRLSPDFDFPFLARNSPGYVGADLMALTREAAMCAVNRVFQALQSQGKHSFTNTHSKVANINLQDCSLMETCDIQTDTETQKTVLPRTSIPSAILDDATAKTNIGDLIDSCATDTNLDNTDINTSHSGTSETVIKIIEISEDLPGNVTVLNISDVPVQTSVGIQAHTADAEANEATVQTVDTLAEHGHSQQLASEHCYCESDMTGTVGVASSVDSDNQPQHEKKDEFLSILCWLKEQPPLTDAQLADLYITMDDFKEALQHVQPSAKREGFATVPDVTWADIGALHSVREELQIAILAPVRHAEEFRSLGLNRAQGILLAGPPGCGKTLLAKAVANESGINFISVKGPELLNMYVGESEKAVRTVFQRARNSSPCVIFFDELDALCPRRSGTADSGSSSRVVNQLLTEMDGLEERKQVFIMAATNRPDIIDPAILRPGRLDKTLYVGLPTQQDRLDILRCITKNGSQPCLGEDVDLMKLAEEPKCDGFTGADLAALVREASVLALREAIKDPDRQPGATIIVKQNHFERAFTKIKPSVSEMDQKKYRNMGDKMLT